MKEWLSREEYSRAESWRLRWSWPNHLGGRDVSRGDSGKKGVKRESWGNAHVYKDRLISRVNITTRNGVGGAGWVVGTGAQGLCMLPRMSFSPQAVCSSVRVQDPPSV